MEYRDELWCGGPGLIQSDEVFKLGTDSVLLADFATVGKDTKVCDLGCGSGVISIILSSSKDCLCTGVELQEAACRLTQRNIDINNLGDKITVVHGDLRRCREFMEAGAFDAVVTNPPYFSENSGKRADNPAIAVARDEGCCTLEDVISAAAYLIRWGGKFFIVHRPENLARIFSLMTQYKIEPKRLRTVSHRRGDAPNLILVEGRRGGKPGLIIEKPLVLTEDSGEDTQEIKRIYHR